MPLTVVNQAVQNIAHAGVVAPAMQSKGLDAGIAALVAHKSPTLIALAEILDELPNLAVTIDEPSRGLRLTFELGEEPRDETFADAAFPARNEDPAFHAVRSSASKALFSAGF